MNNPAQYGRYGDTTLVHMSPEEVRSLEGLASLAGASLTVNPVTGYPEAFSLKSLLPTILGVGATMIGGPMAGAAVTGAIEGIRSGDPLRGLTAGALSAGLGSALGSLGQGATTTGVGEVVTDAATDAMVNQGLQAAPEMVAAFDAAGNIDPFELMRVQGGTLDPSLMAGEIGMAAPGAVTEAVPPPSMMDRAGQWVSDGVQSRHPGWSTENLWNNVSSGNFKPISGAAKLGMGIGGLGMANYWSQDAMEAEQAGRNAEREAEMQRVRDRYNYYADMARQVNSGRIAPPSFLPAYPGGR